MAKQINVSRERLRSHRGRDEGGSGAPIGSGPMVATPWGDSGSLRERKLQPVRGTPAEEVERNQRDRLFAAMIACVAERGYAATSVEDIVELSGVSRRSFYDSFSDKAECLKAAVEELFAVVLGLLEADG